MALNSDHKKILRHKVDAADLALVLHCREDHAGWAHAHIVYAEALLELAEAEDDDEHALDAYQQAIRSYEQALRVFTKKQDFSRWGGVMVSYGRALRYYGARLGDQEGCLHLNYALRLLNEVEDALPQKEGDFDRALVRVEKGYVLRALSNNDLARARLGHLIKALSCFNAAARVLRAKESFKHWALVKAAAALAALECSYLEEQSKARAYLEQAVADFDAALAYYQPDSHPYDWAIMEFEKGRALVQLAMIDPREKRYATVKEAVALFENAKEVLAEQALESTILRLYNEMAFALLLLAQQDACHDQFAMVEKAAHLYQEMIALAEQKGNELFVAGLYGSLGKAFIFLLNLVDKEEDITNYRSQAVEALRKAVIKELAFARPVEWLSYSLELAVIYQAEAMDAPLGEAQKLLRAALAIYNEAFEKIPVNQAADLRPRLHQWRGFLCARLGQMVFNEEGLQLLQQAEEDFTALLEIKELSDDDRARFCNHLAHALFARARRFDCDETCTLLPRAVDLVASAAAFFAQKQADISDYDYLEEWLDSTVHHALFLWRFADFCEHMPAFLEAQKIFEELLNSDPVKKDLKTFLTLKINYALFLKDFGAKVEKRRARCLLLAALGHLRSAVNEARVAGIPLHKVKIKADCKDIEERLKALQPWFWRWWPHRKGDPIL
ncbi:hypothetical protein [Bartonella sp. DGB2]|uniref:hypothetical protein n=1 Tax=Bartonella sp. DGB2 TaxID=3388426 RepID=UPI00398FF6F2